MAEEKRPLRVLIAASGSGGHLIPAVLIAQAIKARKPEALVHFIGSGRPLEREIVDGAGFERHVLPAIAVKQRGLRGLVDFLMGAPGCLRSVWRLLSDFKPDLMIGVGGYVTVFPVMLASLRGVPSWIHEAEIGPGLANRFLAFFASRISMGFKGCQFSRMKKAVYTGQPIKPELTSLGEQPFSKERPRNVLVMGGSQGAQSLDMAMLEMADLLKEHDLSIYHQCRPENQGMLEEAYRHKGIEARVARFIKDTREAFDFSDIIISRAGAGSVMEIGIVNRPAILVPYPFAQANHQAANAETLVQAGKALLVEEDLEPGRDGGAFDTLGQNGEDFAKRLRKALETLLDRQEYKRLRALPFEGRICDAASRIAEGALGLIKRAA